MSTVLDIITISLISIGVFFFIVGLIGLVRLPDVFTRLHAVTKCDTLGVGAIIFGLMIYQGFDLTSVKLLMIIFFVYLTNPTAAQIISKGGYISGVDPCGITDYDKCSLKTIAERRKQDKENKENSDKEKNNENLSDTQINEEKDKEKEGEK